ncbi:MAG: hypothetical protein IJT43_01810 [Stomatobaculum sp.]|nr:hypothetical protein [Stomatobaculum sp.]
MEGYKSFKEAVESVSSAADSWQDLSTGVRFGIDELRQIGDKYDEVAREAGEPDGCNYFFTVEESGEIGLANIRTREVEFLFVPEGSKYQELIAAQDKWIEELREAMLPVLEQMVLDKIDELGDDPEKFVAVFQRDSEMIADDLIGRADHFEKPGLRRLNEDAVKDEDAANVWRMLKTPGLIEKTEAFRNDLRNHPEPLIETDSRTVYERMDYCLKN